MKLGQRYYKLNLTPQNAGSLGYMYVEDIKLSGLPTNIEAEYYERLIKDNKYVIGQPDHSDQPDVYIGIYKKLLKDLPVHETLTPDNAESRGYVFIQNIMYDTELPHQAGQNYIDLVENEGYVLGKPAGDMWPGQGLYAPLESKSEAEPSKEFTNTKK